MRKNYAISICMVLAFLLVTEMGHAQPQLLARYPLDETEGTVAMDVSGNGFDATVNCADCWAEGTIDGALHFDGTVNVTLPADAMGMTSNIGSVSFWVKSDDNLDEINTMFWAGDNDTGGGFGDENELHVHMEKTEPDIWEGGEVSFFVIADPNTFVHSDPQKGGNPGVPPVDPVLINDGEWHHIAATWGSGFVALYIDGVVMWDTTAYNPTGYNLNHMFLGQMANESRTLYGSLDDVRIYNNVLAGVDVQDLFSKDYTHVNQPFANETSLRIYPNPASGSASIRFIAEAGNDVSVNLYSLVGAEVGHIYQGLSLAGENEIQLSTSTYLSGVYVVKLEVGKKVSYSKLVIKK